MFDYRNKEELKYDLEILDEVKTMSSPYLYVFHLKGQHFYYEQRYPKSFAHFSKVDYEKKYSDEQRAIIAHYDNACLYNDYVVDSIFKIFKEQECIIIYFSDHGQEVYELRDYMGHGNSLSSPDMRYQICVPFFVWMSDTYKEKHIELYNHINSITDIPIKTNDLCHFFMDVCNIKTESFDPNRSFINKQYDPSKHRIVMTSVDFDTLYPRR